MLVESLAHNTLRICFGAVGCVEAYAAIEVLHLTRANVRRHYDYGILEIHLTSKAISESSFVHHLQQHIEHIAMSLFYLIKENHRVGVTSHFLGELSALLIAYISRRCTHKARHCKFLHKFTHIHTNNRVGRVKQRFSQLLCQICLTYTRRTKEHKCADRLIGVFKSHSVAANGFHYLFDGSILSDYCLLKLFVHAEQPHSLRLRQTLCRNAGHHCHHLSHLVHIYNLALLSKRLLPACLGFVELFAKTLLKVAVIGCTLKVLSMGSLHFIGLSFIHSLLKVVNLLWHHNI